MVLLYRSTISPFGRARWGKPNRLADSADRIRAVRMQGAEQTTGGACELYALPLPDEEMGLVPILSPNLNE